MSLHAFFDNFPLLADAPNGVAKLRELILQLAIRGQLDTQNNNDEPAMDLARKIQLHKARLSKNKQIRDSKPLPATQSSEILFEIPHSWQWIRLGEIGDWGAGATPDRKNPKYYGGNLRWFKSGELNDGYIHESEETITELALKECSLRLNQPGDVFIAMYGATIGKLAILETEATTNQAVCACTCFKGFYNQFLFVLLRAYKSHFTGRGAGGAQPNISREKIIHTIAPLPPLEEQKRIVAKVNELMRLCDELEARQHARSESRVRLNNAKLAPLNNAASLALAEFDHASVRLADNFATLYDSAETVGNLRSTILQLAVQGKLVPQDPHHEPASALLDRFSAEIKELAGENGLLQALESLEPSLLMPSGWKSLRLGDLVKFIGGSQPPKSKFIYESREGFTRLVQIRDFKSDTFKTYVPNEYANRSFSKDDVMIGRYGPPVFQILRGLKGTYNVALMKASPIEKVLSKDYLYYLLQEPKLQNLVIAESERTAGQSGVRKELLHNYIVGLPPLEEQKRIVARVNQLMALCDELEAKLRQAEADGEKLMNAAVQHVLASISETSTSVSAGASV